VAEREAREALDIVLRTLTPREEIVLRRRFGLWADGQEQSRAQLGESFAVTHERIAQIEAKAMRKLNNKHRLEKLRPFFESIKSTD